MDINPQILTIPIDPLSFPFATPIQPRTPRYNNLGGEATVGVDAGVESHTKGVGLTLKI